MVRIGDTELVFPPLPAELVVTECLCKPVRRADERGLAVHGDRPLLLAAGLSQHAGLCQIPVEERSLFVADSEVDVFLSPSRRLRGG